jgi:hypothetical protein
LAIELAAAQVPMMSPAELGRALDQRFDVLAGGRRGGIERHQTLRATIDWSYKMLDDAQQRLWARLAVFAGGCTRDAAEAVCVGGPVEERAVLALLRGLVARSLAAPERGGNATRYRLLETIRAYGEDRLVEHGETHALRDRHAAFYAELARHCGEELDGPERMDWDARMSADSENMLAAFAHAIDTGNLDLVVMMLESTPPNSPQTGYQLSFPVDSVLAIPGVEHHPGYPLVLMAAATAANLRGEAKLAREYGDAALEVERASTVPRPYILDLEAARCFLEGLIASSTGSWEGAAAAWLEASEIFRRRGKPAQAATSLGAAASALVSGGRFADAIPLATEALALARATNTATEQRHPRGRDGDGRLRAGPRSGPCAARRAPGRPRRRELRRSHATDPRRGRDRRLVAGGALRHAQHPAPALGQPPALHADPVHGGGTHHRRDRSRGRGDDPGRGTRARRARRPGEE